MNRTENQKAAIECLDKYVCVDAGAGSGKTSVLVERIVYLLERFSKQDGLSLDKIVAITFTDAAAAELKVRLREEFRKRAPRDNPEEMTRWRDLERRIDTARVSTIHSFCASILRENALRIGMDPDFSVMAEDESKLLRNETVTDTIHRLLDAGNEPALRAATQLRTGTLIAQMNFLLGHRRLMERIAQEHEAVVDPERLVAHWQEMVQDTRKQNLLELARSPRMKRLRDELASFEGACIKTTDGRETARIEMMTLLDGIIRAENANRIVEYFSRICDITFKNPRKANWKPEEVYDQVKAVQEEIRDLAQKATPDEIDPQVESRAAQLTGDVVHVYQEVAGAFAKAKVARSTVDFDDLISTTAHVLRTNPDVLARTARGIRYLLIDEFQDTDGLQLEIARLLSDHPEGANLFLVGDAKQSIYDFRGAEVEVFQGEKNTADKVIPLDRNFRSLPDVLDFANDLFARTGLLSAVEPEYKPLACHRDPTAQCRIEFLVPEEIEKGLVGEYRSAEAEMIASRLWSMCSGPEPVEVFEKDGSKRPASFGDAAILFRSTPNIYLYEEPLRRMGIPYNVVAGVGFYERQEILDLRNLLTVIIDPWDEVALLGFLRGPIAALSDESIAVLCTEGGLVPAFLSDVTPEHIAGPDRLRRARALVRELRERREMPVPLFLRYVLDRTGYEAIVLSQFMGVQKAVNVRKAVEMSSGFSRTAPPKLAAFVHYLESVAIEEVREGDAPLQSAGSGSVTLMSIHKAKGLEFPIVVIADTSQPRRSAESPPIRVHRTLGMATRVTTDTGEPANPALYDLIREEDSKRAEAESARILYVALTRARDYLLVAGKPEKMKNSWMDVINREFGIVDRPEGDTLSGNNWEAVVRRKLFNVKPEKTGAHLDQALSFDDVAPRLERSVTSNAGRLTFSVSELLDAMTDTQGSEEDDGPRALGDPIALTRGSLVHRMFETWDFRDDAPDFQGLRRDCPAAKTWRLLEPVLRDTANRFLDSALGRRMRNDAGLEREKPFLLRIGGVLVSGTIDAILDDGTIIDYKTGRRSEEREARYDWQLRLYALAVRSLPGTHPNTAIVYYTDTSESHDVDLSENMLEEALARAKTAIDRLRQGACD